MNKESQPSLEIAIVGMAGRFPGAGSVEEFWRNLRAGVESIRDLSDEELRAAGVDDATLADPRFVRRAADLKDAELFDAALFGFTPREAGLMDPQFRVFLEDCWAALESAGYLSDRHDLRIGVFAGAGPNTYLLNNVFTNRKSAESVGGFQTSIGNQQDYLATHVSYRLDLRGPSLVVQTACSTSLVAVHLACQSLLGHECDVALAGGVSISVPQTAGYLHEEGGIASPDGHCRAFDEAAAGCVKGNGSGLVVLRRLEDALRDRDRIRAVIKGTAVNNDGSVKVGFTAPSDEGQAGVIAEALSAAVADPGSIDFVEAHGTGTSLGDPVEVAALARAFGPPEGRTGRCALGSLKTNVGHLDAAAGVAGLIKAALALERREIPPSLHFRRANPNIDFAGSAFYVNAELREWPRNGGGPRRAGVSSFGIGGTNAHAILEEAPETPPSGRGRAAQLFVLSAATESALALTSAALAAHLQSGESPHPADAAYTLQVGRKRLPWRRSVVAADAAEAAGALLGGARRESARRDERRGAQVVFLFPGQGAQHPGMAAALHRDEPAFREAFDRCSEILLPLLGLDLGDPVFAGGEDPAVAEERLRQTSLAQPALFSVEYALSRLWISWGIRPAAMAGHSVGEYVAAALAGVFSLEDALRLVAERGRLMAALPRGAMLAVQLAESELASHLALHPSLSIAAVNGPKSCVASGPEGEISRLEARLDAARVAHRRVATSHAFHSAMMDPIVGVFEERVRRVRLSAPSIPFLSNLSGTWITGKQAIDPAYWASHVRCAVRFADNLAALVTDPSRVLLEVGPGAALSSFARQQAAPEATIISSLRPPKEAGDDSRSLLRALGELWVAGADVDWAALHQGHLRRRIPLPTYPFERQRHWIEAGPRAGEGQAAPASAKEPDVADWFYVPGWKRSLARPQAAESNPPWLVFDDGSALSRAVIDRATALGAPVETVRVGAEYARLDAGAFAIDPRQKEHYEALLRDLRADGKAPGRIVHLWCAEGSRLDAEAAQDLGFFSLLHLIQAWGALAQGSDLRLVAVTADLFDVTGEAVVHPERATLVGPCRVAPQECPGLTCRLIDVGDADASEAAGRIALELDTEDREPLVAWRGGYRWIPSYEKVRLDPPPAHPAPLRPGGAFLLTGGLGPFETAIARRLAAAGAKGIAFLDCEGSDAPLLEELRRGGIEVFNSPARVTSSDDLAAAVDAARSRLGRLDAVFHTAGDIGGGMIQLKDREAAGRVLAPRLEGTRALVGRLREDETLVLFSSAISATGVFGQVDFCAASAALDAFAQAPRDPARPRVVAIDWGTAHWDRWQGATGPGSEALLEQLREIQSSVGITLEEGVDALWRCLALGARQVVVSPQDLQELIAQSTSSSVTDFLAEAGRTAAAAANREGRDVAALDSATERQVAQVWTDLLGIDRIGRTDNFFELGGNSLLAIQLASHLRKAFDIDLSIASLFESADLAALAAAVDAALVERRESEEVARLLEEIEGLSEEAIRVELAQGAAGAREAAE